MPSDVTRDATEAEATPRSRRRRWPWIAAVTVVLIGALVAAGTAVFQFGWPWERGKGDHDHVHESADGTRIHYQVHVPPAHGDGVELPVMMALHGCGMTGFGWNSMKGTTQFDDLADREGFIVVYPTQRPFESAINCWNSADPRNQQRNAGEPALLAGIARDVVETYGADPDRIHVSGASSGAGAAVILGVTYPDVFATVTSVAGAEYGANQVDVDDLEATPATATAAQAWAQMGDRARAVPMLVVQGGLDEVVSPFVGRRLVEHWIAVNDLVDDGLPNDSLALVETTTAVDAVDGAHAYEWTDYSTTAGVSLIRFYYVPELGHAWPGPAGEGSYTDQRGPDAAEIAWRFAQQHDLATDAESSAPVDVSAALTALEDEFAARLGVSAVDTGTGATVQYREGERFGFASTLKAFAAAEFLRQTPADERGERVTWTQAQVDAAGYSPVTSAHVAEGLTLAELAEAAVRDSDNTAMNLILERIGGPAGLGAALAEGGDTTSEVVNGEPELNTIEPGSIDDTTTAAAFAADLAAYLTPGPLDETDRATLIDWMSGNETGDPLIRAGAPAGWTVADKSGGAGAIRNDIAVVFPPDRAPIVIAIMSEKVDPTHDFDNALVARAAEVLLGALE